MEDVKLPPEYSETATNPKRFAGRPVTGAFNVTVPTLTVFPAQQPGNGTAMLVFPGGGFSKPAIDLEGSEVREWLTSRGTTCVLVKSNVPQRSHPRSEERSVR